jgi:fatty-acyl-CoA synthase
VAVPHDRWGERPVAILVVAPGHEAPTLDELHTHLADHVPRWWRPDALTIVDALPRTSSGKIRKALLRQEVTPPR